MFSTCPQKILILQLHLLCRLQMVLIWTSLNICRLLHVIWSSALYHRINPLILITEPA